MFESSYFSVASHVTLVIFYMIATTICIFASALVWIVVLARRDLKSPMNYLLLSMSLSDIISSLSVYPYLFILDPTTISSSQKATSNLCMITEGLSSFFIASATSLLILCAISFNRFLAIKYPTNQSFRMGRRSVLIFSIIAWITGICCMVPGMVSFKWNNQFKVCVRNWRNIKAFPYRISIMLFGLMLPASFLLLTYSAIYFKAREILPFDETNSRAFWHRQSRIRKAEKMLGALILVYVICWFPFITFWLLSSVTDYFSVDTREGNHRGQRWLMVTVLFCTLNGTLNPFIYTLGSKDLKSDMIRIAGAMWRKSTCRKSFPISPTHKISRFSTIKGIISKETQQNIEVDC